MSSGGIRKGGKKREEQGKEVLTTIRVFLSSSRDRNNPGRSPLSVRRLKIELNFGRIFKKRQSVVICPPATSSTTWVCENQGRNSITVAGKKVGKRRHAQALNLPEAIIREASRQKGGSEKGEFAFGIRDKDAGGHQEMKNQTVSEQL